MGYPQCRRVPGGIMQKIAALIRRSLRLPVFLPLLALALAATWYGLGPSLARIIALTGGARFVDMQPGITPAALIGQLRSYSPEALRFYFWWTAFDFAWPLLTFTAMLFITAWLYRFLPERAQPTFVFMVGSAYATVLMDWGENLGFLAVILAGSPQPLEIAGVAVLLHRAKLFFNFVFNGGFFVVLGWALVRLARGRHRAV